MKNLKEFKASGENSSTADPIETGDTSLPTGKRKGEGQDPMPTLDGAKPQGDFIDTVSTTQAPTRRADKRNSEPMPKLKGMREVLNLMATMSNEQVEELVSALSNDEDTSEEEVKVADLVKEDFDAIFGSSELSEDAQAKIFALFEGAVLTKITEEKARIEAEYEARIDEEIEELTSELEDRINRYMDHVAEEWMTANEVAVASGIRTEFSESFIEGLKTLFAEHYVAVPEGKDDIIESLASRVEDLEDRLDKSLEENTRIMDVIKEKARDEALAEQLDGLTDVQKEKLSALAEGVEYADIAEFEAKVKILKENFLAEKAAPKDPGKDLNEEVEVDPSAPTVSPQMKAYLDALARNDH